MLIDICGQTFDQLHVVRLSDKATSCGERMWVCECSCGRIVHVRGWELRSGKRTCCRYCSPKTPRGPRAPREPKKVKSVGPHEPKTDCRAYAGDRCAGLKEMLCRTRGKCKFYKSREGE